MRIVEPILDGLGNPEGLDVTPSGSIGMNLPLYIRLHRVFTGDRSSRAMLVTSSVKSITTFEAGPRALNFVIPGVDQHQFPTWSPAEPGSPIVYFTPANLDQTLGLEVRLAFDDLDRDLYDRWIDVARQALGLPVFALGPLAGVAGQAVVVAAAQVAKVIVGAIDRKIDGRNDFIARYDINIETPDLLPAKPGWLLLRERPADNETFRVGDDGARATSDTQDSKFYVDNVQGHLRWKDSGDVVDNLHEPYVLLHLSGVTSDRLEKYTPTLVSAALAARFLDLRGDAASDVTEVLGAYNDVVMSNRVGDLDREIKGEKDAARKKALVERREALLKHIQDDGIREVLKKGS